MILVAVKGTLEKFDGTENTRTAKFFYEKILHINYATYVLIPHYLVAVNFLPAYVFTMFWSRRNLSSR